jgi:hypothetical protein
MMNHLHVIFTYVYMCIHYCIDVHIMYMYMYGFGIRVRVGVCSFYSFSTNKTMQVSMGSLYACYTNVWIVWNDTTYWILRLLASMSSKLAVAL